ncbi:MAG: hypothetical protein AB7O48_00275 [Cyclobacteriaceae bacterium]
MKEVKKTKGNYSLAGSLLLITLAFMYLLGTVEVQSIHTFLHNSQDEVALHSKENESNACHQKVYHNKKEESCSHKSHVVALKKCPLCQLTIQSLQLFTPSLSTGIFISVDELHFADEHIVSISAGQLLPARAPPVA